MGYYVYSLVLSAFFCCAHSQRYIVPEATLEFLSPKGLRISIPDDDPEIKLVAYHINVNEEFQGLDHGQFGVDITKKRNGRWSYNIPQLKLKHGDIIYYWIHVIVDKLGYNGLDREYRVVGDPHGGGIGNEIPQQPSTDQTNSCGDSQSNRDGVTTPVCRGKVLLNKKFNNMDGWSYRVTIGGSSPEDEFVVFSKDSFTSFIEDRQLVIKPGLLEEKYNASFVRSGNLLLEGCTSTVAEQCIKQARTYLILPPIISARLNTKNKFTFRYGTVEIKAKLPRGDWIVPELWLEPVNGPETEKVVMGMSRGNMDDSEFGWKTLEAGVVGASRSSMGKKTQGTPWSEEFHIFKLQWTKDQMIFMVDNQEIHRIPAVNFPVLSKEFYISLGVHVAGGKDFPESINRKPWKNSDPKRFVTFWDSKEKWQPTWHAWYSCLKVEYIKITAV